MLRKKINRTEQEVQEWAGGGGGTFVILTESLEKGLAKETLILSTCRPLGTECHAEDSESQARR